ncbi:MAG: hypothetical protein ABSC06_35055 [Rhodopila sp.]
MSPTQAKIVPTPTPKRSSLAELTAELVALAGITRAANAEELGQVETWLADAFSPETMRGVIEVKRRRANYRPPTSLVWFDGAMWDTRKPNGRGPPASQPSPPPPAAISEADQAIKQLVKPFNDAWLQDRSCPFPPGLESFKAACAAEETRALAYQWLETWKAWNGRNRVRDLKPPDFTLLAKNPDCFEADLLAIEETLTGPDPPEAAD